MANIKITQLTEKTIVNPTDYFVVDDGVETQKVKAENITIDAYTKAETDNLLNAKANVSTTYTKTEVDNSQQAQDLIIDRNARSLEYLWKKSKGIIYDTEILNGTSYQVSVPSGAMDYASMQMIGGMSIVVGGSIKDAKVDKIITKGVNVWNEYWELGTINTSTGQNASSSSRIRSVGYIDIQPNTDYYSYIVNNESTSLYWYDEDKTFISYQQAKNISVTSPSNAKYMRFIHATSTYNNNFMISLNSNPRKQSYVPYFAPQEKAIPSAIQNLDGYGKGINSSAYNYVDFTPTKYENMKSVDLGTLTWGGTSGAYTTTISDYVGSPLHSSIPNTSITKSGTTITFATTTTPSGTLHYQATSGGTDYNAYLYHMRVGTRAYQSGDENNASYLTDMTTTYYPLATEQILDITPYVTQDLEIIQIEANGTITYHYPQLDNGYGVNVPSVTELMVEVDNV